MSFAGNKSVQLGREQPAAGQAGPVIGRDDTGGSANRPKLVPNQVQPERRSLPSAANFLLGEKELLGRIPGCLHEWPDNGEGQGHSPLQNPSEHVICFVLERIRLHSPLGFLVPRPPPSFREHRRGWKPI